MKKKQGKPRWRKEGARWVATLPNSVVDQLEAEHRASREAAKAEGRLGPKCGLGAWGGTKRQQSRRNRKLVRVHLSRGRPDE